MTAYGAVSSLKITIHHILRSCRLSLDDPSLNIIQLAYSELDPLKAVLRRLDSSSKSRSRKKVNALDGRIKEAIWKFEDSLESLVSDQLISQFESPDPDQPGLKRSIRRRLEDRVEGFHLSRINWRIILSGQKAEEIDASQVMLFSIDLQRLQDDADSLIQRLKEMEEEYIYELENMAEDDEASPSIIGFGGIECSSKMIGFSDQFEQIKQCLMEEYRVKVVHALYGMAGVGKTTLAREIYRDPEIVSRFECRAWVTVGRIPQISEVSRGILSQLHQGDEKQSLKGKICLIVLDDVWERQVLASLTSLLPDIEDGMIQILLTARDRDVDIYHNQYILSFPVEVVRFLNEKESKDLLCHKVFGGEEMCPPQLDKAAAKIAKKCEGLPLLILTVAQLLSEAQNTDPQYWDDVAEMRNSVFTDAYDQMSEVLFPSYNYLAQHFKMFFLYLGVFPPDYEIPTSKITSLLTTEGWFLDTYAHISMVESVHRCLGMLGKLSNLVLYNVKSKFWQGAQHVAYYYKTCRLHSSWRHLCRGEARKNKFFHVVNRLVDVLSEEEEEEDGIKGQRGLCLQNNILFSIKEFCYSVESICAASARSLLFFGPYHQYPIPIHVTFKLLSKLDALNLRFYTFPTDILNLVQLKYLALTCNGELPTTISKLFSLGVLIIHPHTNVKRGRAPSYIPIQIWDMQELEHIEILGKSLPSPNHVVSLEKLLTLVGVNADICTIFNLSKRIPRLRKLGVQIELTPYDDQSNLLSCFRSISTLEDLDTLKCSIMNPVLKYGYVAAPTSTPSTLMLPRGLRKLHLSGMGFPSWEYMDVIGSLPHLEVLKLRSYAFRGSKWETKAESFLSLMFLLIEDSELVQWKPRDGSFPKLNYLSMKHCYKLQELHWPSDSILGKIELVDCNPLSFTFAKQLRPKSDKRLHLTLSSSFEEKPVTVDFER